MVVMSYIHFYKRKIKKKNKRKFINQVVFDLLPEFKALIDSELIEYKYKQNREQSIIKL